LPEGLFSNQKSQYGKIFQGLRLENVDIFNGDLEYFMNIWDSLRPLHVHLVIFSGFGVIYQEKTGNPDAARDYQHKDM
jgi:hypothetical protein